VVGREHAEVHDLIGAGAAHEGREAGDEIGGAQLEVGGAVAPRGLDGQEDLAVWCQVEAVPGEGGAEEVAAELLSAVLALPPDGATGVEVEAVASGLLSAGEGAARGVAQSE